MLKYFLVLLKCIFIIIFLVTCKKPDQTYYTINQVRAVGVVVQTSALSTGANNFQSTSSQQFPIRPNCSAGSTEFDIVVISPTNEIPTLTINNLKLLPIGNYYLASGGGSRGLPNGTNGTSIAMTNIFTSATATPTTVFTSPYRLTVFKYIVDCANIGTNLSNSFTQISDIPAFQLSYTVSSGTSSDQGFYTFYTLPDNNDSFWNTSPVNVTLSSNKISSLTTGLAITNNPIQFSSISPAANSVLNGNSSSSISVGVTIPSVPFPRDPNNTNFQAKTRIQWYVTNGSLSLDTSSSTDWNPESNAGTTVGGFVVVRDLLGGVDFKVFGPFTTQ
ncbi:hypothetical protein [Fluviispira multicolorata]|uniref:Uncharacterized protein n=1 Tax=Fluviispira multicolorata TaxID=2654512 RepID=A0A833N308_9BACT|nr:hypothetical protein [Fluviispira multicolorata]KAB8033428.1 hypothetical protein GCL57_01630 [Fluviispira multicolorata]